MTVAKASTPAGIDPSSRTSGAGGDPTEAGPALANSGTFWGLYTADTYLVDAARGRSDPVTIVTFGASAAVLLGPLLYLSSKTRGERR